VVTVYFHTLGLAGHSIRRVGSDGLGYAESVLPLSLLVGGVALVARRIRHGVIASLVSLTVLILAAAAIGDLLGNNPKLSASMIELGVAGGFAGAIVGRPFAALLGVPGGIVVLLVIALVAAITLCGIPMRVALGAVGRNIRLVALSAANSIREARDGHDAEVAALDLDDPELRERTAEIPITPAMLYDAAEDDGPALAHHVEVDDAPEEPRVMANVAAPIAATGSVGEQLSLPVVPMRGNYHLPPAKLLKRSKEQSTDMRAVEARGLVLQHALAAHGVETNLAGFTVGPTVTRFELELGLGVKVARVTSLAKDIAYAMASPDVRILAPIPGRSAIGVEVPNVDRHLVTLGDVLAADEARRATHPLEVALGRDIAGRAVMANLAEMPHLLIAGATGAGKSSCINSTLTSILMRSTPDQVRLILVDPKRVELGQYNGLPHLLTPVVVNPKRAANALHWAVVEMERRYDLLAEAGMRDITGYNAAVDRGDFASSPFSPPVAPNAAVDEERDDDDFSDLDTQNEFEEQPHEVAADLSAALGSDDHGPEKLPFILIVVDELNDLMMVAARDVEESICRIAQMARAVGIHLVIATQRPSVDVITGVIKANIPSRLAFSVSSLADSRVILDQPGAERLVGRGDLLLLTASSSVARRIQGPWVSEDEVRGVVNHWRRQSEAVYDEAIIGQDAEASSGAFGAQDDDDELLPQALELVIRSQLGSTSMLQRKLRVGFSRAGRLMDLLERRGVVGPSEGSKPREVLMTPEEFDGI
jgi:S-DNA-T family DNA segregation ATPase FtsK/SpoIIIE